MLLAGFSNSGTVGCIACVKVAGGMGRGISLEMGVVVDRLCPGSVQPPVSRQ